jgi:transcriptional regulator with XRE-family HTH domain
MPTTEHLSSNAIDEHVGRQLRRARRASGLSQAQLAERLSLTFQQVQKYERGINRLSASKMFLAAAALDVPISTFYDGLTLNDAAPPVPLPPLSALGEEVARNFDTIQNRKVQTAIAGLLRALAPGSND